MILIISDPLDVHVRWVRQRLTEVGAPSFRFDVGEVPTEGTLTAALDARGLTGTLRSADGALDLASVRTVWFRRLSPVCVAAALDAEGRAFAAAETEAFLASLAAALGDRFCVNPLATALATDRGRGKVSQLERARALGLAIPRTLATNDPAAARAFLESCPDGAIYKPFRAPTRVEGSGPSRRLSTVFTTKLDATALARLDAVRDAPCLFQELVPKRADVRVTVIGERVFATEIHSQGDPRSAVDFRAHYALDTTPYASHTLPREVEKALLGLVRDLGLVFAAADLVLTPDGRHVFLEVNQQGQFLWLEEKTGQPLLEAFCQLLIQGTPSFHFDATSHEPGLPALAPVDPRFARRVADD